MFGCENEVESRMSYYREYGSQGEMLQYRPIKYLDRCNIYVKQDGSLRAGFEINTHPFNFNWLKKYDPFAYLDEIGHTLKVTRRCGFHIHLNESYFTKPHKLRLIKFIHTNPDFFKMISQRKNFEYCRFASNYIKDYLQTGDCYDDKYFAITMGVCTRTVELRLFQGTINKKLINTYLELALALVLYTRLPNPSVEGFKVFIEGEPEKYSNILDSNILYGKVVPEYHYKYNESLAVKSSA